MNADQRDLEDFRFLSENGAQARRMKHDRFLHLDQPIGVWNYIRIANEIAAEAPPGRLLDWGCGFGQMTYLMRRRGFDVTSFDVEYADFTLPDLPLTRELSIVRSSHPTDLPFPNSSFDVVLSCGVLEHVDEFSSAGNELRSLAEIRRVLKPSGYLFIYQLPQLYTWQEAITRTLGIGYSHPRRYTANEIRSLLGKTGYAVMKLRRGNFLPKNLTGLPDAIRSFYSRFSVAIIRADAWVSSIPFLNQLAGVMEIIARPAAAPDKR